MTGAASISALATVEAIRIGAEGELRRDDRVAAETPVAMVYNGRSQAVMMATPADLEDFALGFSLSEAIIDHAGQMRSVDVCQGGDGIELQVRIDPDCEHRLSSRNRTLTGRSGCGLCGADSLANAIRPVRKVAPMPAVTVGSLREAFDQLHGAQVLNQQCSGLHAAGFAHSAGLLVREDVGRHNALDKVLGARALAGLGDGFALTTSRASYEMVHKTAQAGIALLAAISAPTALAIALAQQSGVTLVAFVREEGMSVYAHERGISLS